MFDSIKRRPRRRMVKAGIAAAAAAAVLGGVALASNASASPAPGPNGFALYSNRSGFTPYVCMHQYDWYGKEIRQDCKKIWGWQKVGWNFETNATSARMSVFNGWMWWHHFYPAVGPGQATCYRESASGSVHQVTNQKCTTS
jgi:hypothetical protein